MCLSSSSSPILTSAALPMTPTSSWEVTTPSPNSHFPAPQPKPMPLSKQNRRIVGAPPEPGPETLGRPPC
eukprot:9845037-Alexandrium_andersonii.AAC.1